MSGPSWDHVGTMVGPSLLPDQLELWNFEVWVSMVQGLCQWNVYFFGPCQGHSLAIIGPCWDHFLPSSNSKPARALKFLKLSWHGLRPMFMKCVHLGPCQGHVWTMLGPCFCSTYRPARALIFSKESQHGLRPMSMDYPPFGTMSGPCMDCVWTMFCLSLLLDQLELWNC